ncbi:hypothetical protein BDY19DRAFT_1060198 [Irpex rosettiformis]|uniref:Uncharacterized protein n=1 Tax=Irpex rosettiformis TaxID=378272 RepID=A0ACB8TRF7_9APHY|nr:hypothetical protein BDY19DRAFT_1060198 [Irpex rosettiformis]
MRPSQLTAQVQRRRERHEEVEAALGLHLYHHERHSPELPKESSFVVNASLVALLKFVAHALVRLDDGTIVGDPMEKTTLDARNWQRQSVHLRRRFEFSVLKRMLTICNLSNGKVFIAVKDAPETIESMLPTGTGFYDETFKRFTRQGSRVLALGHREVGGLFVEKITKVHRDDVEVSLIFVDFLVFHCPLKADAMEIPRILNDASHRTPLATIQESLLQEYDICMTGAALKRFGNLPAWNTPIQRIWVYARASPNRKDLKRYHPPVVQVKLGAPPDNQRTVVLIAKQSEINISVEAVAL